MLHVGDDDPDWLLRFFRLTTLWHLDLHSLVFGTLVASPIRFTDATSRTCALRPASLQRRCRGVRKAKALILRTMRCEASREIGGSVAKRHV